MGISNNPNKEGKKDGERGEKNIGKYILNDDYKKGFDYGKGVKNGSEHQEDLLDSIGRSFTESKEYNKGYNRGEKLRKEKSSSEESGNASGSAEVNSSCSGCIIGLIAISTIIAMIVGFANLAIDKISHKDETQIYANVYAEEEREVLISSGEAINTTSTNVSFIINFNSPVKTDVYQPDYLPKGTVIEICRENIWRQCGVFLLVNDGISSFPIYDESRITSPNLEYFFPTKIQKLDETRILITADGKSFPQISRVVLFVKYAPEYPKYSPPGMGLHYSCTSREIIIVSNK